MRNYGPYPQMFSRFGRLTAFLPSTARMLVVKSGDDEDYRGSRLTMQVHDKAFLGDEYPARYYDATIGTKLVVLAEIPAQVIFQDIGDGQEDYVLDRVIFSGQEPEDFGDPEAPTNIVELYTYQEGILEEPKLQVTYRNTAYIGQSDFALTDDLVLLAMRAYPQQNLYRSLRQTPANSVDAGANDPEVGRESVVLIAPMKSFRRMQIRFSTVQYTVLIRLLQFLVTQRKRKSWG